MTPPKLVVATGERIPPPPMDPYSFLNISPNPDGSLTRARVFPLTAAGAGADADSYDVPLNPSLNTTLRVFLPRNPPANKLPIILYFHGSGFIVCSPATAPIHHSCARLAAHLPAAVLSVAYRLAPEHRLPAAYLDALDALLWLRAQSTSLSTNLPDRLDWSRCYLMGCSAGANIAYHAAIRAADMNLTPVRISGLILDQPYFGGVERTESETRMAEDRILPLPANDLLWELALPVGAGRDHEYCDVRAAMPPKGVIKRCLVRGHEGDPLIDRQREVARVLEAAGTEVVARFAKDGFHGVEALKPEKLAVLLDEVKDFVGVGGGRL